MEDQMKTAYLLDRVPTPGFYARSGRILSANQAAEALMLRPGDDVMPLLGNFADDYAGFQSGQMYLQLTLGENTFDACVIRMDAQDLFLLELPEAEEEFRAMALVSSQLRAPLMNAITSAGHLLDRQESDDPETAAHAGQMNRSLMQLMRLVCNLSDAGRYAGSARMELRDVSAFLEEVFEKARTLTAGAVSFIGLPTPVFSLIDPEQLERAVWNLLSNAIKFTPKGGSIHGQLTKCGSKLHLTIRDSGSGIAEELRSTVFQRYLRQPGIEDNRFGMGLGMVLVRTTAANHGGTVLIRKNGDTGTQVTMTLAIREAADNLLRSPILLPDYSGGWDHGLLELSDCLPPECYKTI